MIRSRILVAALLGDTKSVLRDVPDISDVHVVSRLLEIHGVEITGSPESGILVLDPANVAIAQSAEIDALSGSSRIPITLIERARFSTQRLDDRSSC